MAPRHKYPDGVPGEWIAPRREGRWVSCCGCGLTHKHRYRLHKLPGGGHQIQQQTFLAPRSTAMIRRHMTLDDFGDVLVIIHKKVRLRPSKKKARKRST